LTSAVATVPGKLILMGEHAVVYGRPALVAALGLRVRVEASRLVDGTSDVELDLVDLGYRGAAGWEELIDYADRARAAWRAYAEDPRPEGFAAVLTGDPAHLVKVALGELGREVGGGERSAAEIAERLPGVSLRVASQIPLGSGFGSSAATAVGVLAAVSALLGGPTDVDTLDRLALEVERRQHGVPSGADHNTVLRGGVLEIRRGDDGALSFRPLRVSPKTLSCLSLFHTGTPAESTGEVVAAVREIRRRNPAAAEALLDRMTGAVEAFALELVREAPELERLAASVREYEDCLEAFGVVPPSVRSRLAEAAVAGATGKISGAGALSDGGAGSLLLLSPAGAATPEALSDYTPVPARLGVPGLELELTE
jgi:mevalonate kinase